MEIIMPQLGETVEEGTITEWLKAEGDAISVDDVLFEVETDKVTTEVPATAPGRLSRILVAAGETVAVGTPVAIIDGGEASAKVVEASIAAASTDAPEPVSASGPAAASRGLERSGNMKLSPVVRRLLKEYGFEPGDITGTGRGGRITRDDVLARAGQAATPGAETPASPVAKDVSVRIPFSTIRKRTAEHMTRSKATSAHVLQAIEVNFGSIARAREAAKVGFKAEHGSSLTYLPFIARALCLAIPDFPNVNATVDGETLVVHGAINLGCAIDLGGDGLVVPVIRKAEGLSVTELALAIAGVAEKARGGGLTPDDMSGGTYTITNNGSFGTLFTAPIINQPQVAILSIDGITKKPVVIEGDDGDLIAIRPVGILAQSFDHRVIDGAYSAAFLNRVKQILQSRDWQEELG